MSLWKDNTPAKPGPTPPPAADSRETPRPENIARIEASASPVAPVAATTSETTRRESLIASDLTIEGKIEGAGSVRIAGRFNGDVNVQGDLTIEAGAKLTGAVRADKVVVAGELEGNVEAASRVELQPSGAITGDVKAGSFTVAAGARMRGQAVFGWGDAAPPAKTERAGGSSARSA
jgi:cytoskeletal protein CcmA (bactofilin family)